MTLLSPLMLWGLLLSLPLAAVYLLKVKPRKRESVALFLWDGIITEKHSTSLWKRLRDLWSLLLLLLVILFLIFALADPREGGDDGADILIAIDRSASMQCLVSSQSRFQIAQNKAHDIVAALDGNRRVAIASIASDVRFVMPRSDDVTALHDAINNMKVSDAPFSRHALKELAAMADMGDGARVILLSDQAANNIPEQIEIDPILLEGDNLGIVELDLRRLPGADKRMGLFVRCFSNYEDDRQMDIVVAQGTREAIVKVIPVTLKPGLNETITSQISNAEAGAWFVSLVNNNASYEDALAIDNSQVLFVNEEQPITVSVTGENPYFLETCVQAFSGIGGAFSLKNSNADLVLAQGSDPGGDCILFQPKGDSELWDSMSEDFIEPSQLFVKQEDHLALRHVDHNVLSFHGAKKIKIPPHATMLLADDQNNPMIYVLRTANRRVAVVNLDPQLGNFVLSPSFPVLVHGLAMALADRDQQLPSVLKTGTAIRMPASLDQDESVVTTPHNDEIRTKDDYFYETDSIGLYAIARGANTQTAAIALKNQKESALAQGTEKRMKALNSGVLMSYWLFIVGLAVLLAEFLLYHRRKVG